MLINENPLLAEETALNKCYKVMDLICEKCMKQRDMNEVLAMKMHYISCIFQKCINFLKDGENKLDTLIKRYCLFLFFFCFFTMSYVEHAQMDNELLCEASLWIKTLSNLAAVVTIGLTFSL